MLVGKEYIGASFVTLMVRGDVGGCDRRLAVVPAKAQTQATVSEA